MSEPATRNQRRAQRRKIRRAARERIATRERSGCPRPDKPAYDPNDPEERVIQLRRLGPGVQMYDCRCGWSHNGHPTAGGTP